MMRKSAIYLAFIGGCVAVLSFLLLAHPEIVAGRHERAMAEKCELVRSLKLTDLTLFTEARYTRHLSQADLYSAFQDHPMSFEHFPSGSVTRPPLFLIGNNP